MKNGIISFGSIVIKMPLIAQFDLSCGVNTCKTSLNSIFQIVL